MQVLRALTLAVAAVTMVAPAQAQIGLDGPVQHDVQVKFVSPGNVTWRGYYVGPYRGMLLNEPGSPVVDLYCVDFLNYAQWNWTANISSVSRSDLSLTRWGMIFGEAEARVRYQKSGVFGRVQTKNASCDVAGVASLEAWRNRQPRTRTRGQVVPRATARFSPSSFCTECGFSPCQPLRSLPLKTARKPFGGAGSAAWRVTANARRMGRCGFI